jgi:pyridoxamine 5'-phosphate oxidase
MFLNWLEITIDMQITEPHDMTLSTVDPDGFPDAHIFNLKKCSEQ